MAKDLILRSTDFGEYIRTGKSSAWQVCQDPQNPWETQADGTALTDYGDPRAIILHVGYADHEVYIYKGQMYAWEDYLHVWTFDAYVNLEEAKRTAVRKLIQPSLILSGRQRDCLWDQFEELEAMERFGRWPQPHTLNFKNESLAAVYVIYSGGETDFTVGGYRRAGYRAYEPARDFITGLYHGYIRSTKAIPGNILKGVMNPPYPEKFGELWMVEKARRAVGLKPKPAHDATWTEVRWRTIELAVELGWRASI